MCTRVSTSVITSCEYVSSLSKLPFSIRTPAVLAPGPRAHPRDLIWTNHLHYICITLHLQWPCLQQGHILRFLRLGLHSLGRWLGAGTFRCSFRTTVSGPSRWPQAGEGNSSGLNPQPVTQAWCSRHLFLLAGSLQALSPLYPLCGPCGASSSLPGLDVPPGATDTARFGRHMEPALSQTRTILRAHHSQWSERKRKTNTIWYHLYMESKLWNKWDYERKRNRPTNIESKLMVTKGERRGRIN